MVIGIEAQRVFRSSKHGMDIVVLETIRHLQQIDRENQYVIFVNEGPDKACLQETENFKIVEFGAPYPIWEQIKLPKMLRKYGCDILHCTSNTAPISCPVPLLVTVHDIIYFESNPLFVRNYSMYQRFGNLYRRFVVKRNLKRAEKIITVSEFEKKRFIERLPWIAPKLDVVYNGVGKHFFVEGATETGLDPGWKIKVPYVLFFGNTAAKKNTKRVIQAFGKLCREADLPHQLVVTDFDRKMGDRLLHKLGLEDCSARFNFVGYVPNEHMPKLMSAADLFLYPSLRESFGIPILEAMAAQTPVITSEVSAMPETAGDAALLVDPFSVDAICDAMLNVLKKVELRQKLVEKGRFRAQKFTWQKSAEQVLGMYKEMLRLSETQK